MEFFTFHKLSLLFIIGLVIIISYCIGKKPIFFEEHFFFKALMQTTFAIGILTIVFSILTLPK